MQAMSKGDRNPIQFVEGELLLARFVPPLTKG
jgi:hypothetical protein